MEKNYRIRVIHPGKIELTILKTLLYSETQAHGCDNEAKIKDFTCFIVLTEICGRT